MIIYKITNSINNKYYIGKDYKNNPNYFGSGLLIKKAIKKYGKENFNKEILEYCCDKEDSNEKEKYWIKKLNSLTPNGYNITEGGTGGDTYSCQCDEKKLEIKNKRWETIEKHGGVWNKGIKMSDEQKENMKGNNLGKKHLNRKKIKLTEEHKNNIRKSTTGLKRTPETKQKIKLAKIGIKMKKESIIKLSNSLKGNKNALGYKFTDEQKLKTSNSHKGLIPWNKNLKTCFRLYILQIPTNEIIEFSGKFLLKNYISDINHNLIKQDKINLTKLIKFKENKNYKLSVSFLNDNKI